MDYELILYYSKGMDLLLLMFLLYFETWFIRVWVLLWGMEIKSYFSMSHLKNPSILNGEKPPS